MRFDTNKCRSLNAAILKMQSEGFEKTTPEVKAAMKKFGLLRGAKQKPSSRSRPVTVAKPKTTNESVASGIKASVKSASEAQRASLREKIAKEIAEHLDKALGGVERMLLPAMQPDTETRNEMREMQTDIKSIMRTLVGHWKL